MSFLLYILSKNTEWILVRQFNSFTPGCAGASYAPWLAASPGEMTVAVLRIPLVSGWLFKPGYFVGNDGICES